MYWKFQHYQINDDRFNYENFGHQPDWLIFQALEYLESEKHDQINASNITNAVGWAGLFNGFGGSDSSKTSPNDLLPYRTHNSDKKLSENTRVLLLKLKNQNKIPVKIWGLLAPYHNEIEPL